MPRYFVTWEIEVFDVATPEDAAREAWEHMRRPGSTANCFTVIDEHGDAVHVDLQEVEETALSLTLRGIGDVLRNAQEAGNG